MLLRNGSPLRLIVPLLLVVNAASRLDTMASVAIARSGVLLQKSFDTADEESPDDLCFGHD